MENPVCHGLASTARSRNSGSKPAGDEAIVELWGETHDGLAVCGNRYRAIDDCLNADFVQDGQALGSGQRKKLEAFHIRRKQLAGKVERRKTPPASLRPLLPAANGERSDIGL